MGGVTYPGGDALGIKNGVFVRLNELIDQYCPNYKEIITSWGQAYEKDSRLDDGTIYSFYNTAIKDEGINFGMMVRQDILDQLGLKQPVTFADWESMLTTIHESFPDMVPLTACPWWAGGVGKAYPCTFVGSQFVSAYGIANGFYQIDGEVRFGPIQPEFKEYLAVMNKWYELGLLDQEFATRSLEIGGFITKFASMDSSWGFGRGRLDPNIDWRAVRAPVLNVGDKIEFGVVNSPMGAATVITSALDHDIDVACKWFDYQYTEEAMLLNCYGLQGEAWEYDENGEVKFTEKLIAETASLAIPRRHISSRRYQRSWSD